MMSNPFHERKPFKKRVITVSVTEAQHDAFLKLQMDLGFPSAGALIKALVAAEIDHYNSATSKKEISNA